MKVVFVDFRITEDEMLNLTKLGLNVFTCPKHEKLYDAICGHPDILIHILNNNTVMVHKNMCPTFINSLVNLGINITYTHKELGSTYPQNIALNAVNFKNIFIHNLKHTDKNLLNFVKHKKLISVKQGYTKCSTAIVSSAAVITSDIGIAKVLNNEGIDVLLLPPGDILLPGLNYGFIGGSCGLIDEKLLAFYGDLNCYAYGHEVIEFLKKHKVEPVFLSKGKLIDRGSILALDMNK